MARSWEGGMKQKRSLIGMRILAASAALAFAPGLGAQFVTVGSGGGERGRRGGDLILSFALPPR
jgi:hypothetical protein